MGGGGGGRKRIEYAESLQGEIPLLDGIGIK